MTTTAKLLGASAIAAAIFLGSKKKLGQDNAAALAVAYGLIAGGYIAKSRTS